MNLQQKNNQHNKIKQYILLAIGNCVREQLLDFKIKMEEKKLNRNCRLLQELYEEKYKYGKLYDDAILSIWLEYSKYDENFKQSFNEFIFKEKETLSKKAHKDRNDIFYATESVIERVLNEVVNAKSPNIAIKPLKK